MVRTRSVKISAPSDSVLDTTSPPPPSGSPPPCPSPQCRHTKRRSLPIRSGKKRARRGSPSPCTCPSSSPSSPGPSTSSAALAPCSSCANSAEDNNASDLVHVDPLEQPMEHLEEVSSSAPPPGDPPSPPSNAAASSGAVAATPASPSGEMALARSDLVFGNTSTRDSGVQTSSPSPSEGKPNILALPEDLKLNLECPVCSRISLPPIMQCRNGHVTCNTCRIKVQSCPMCREIDIDIRNMFAEKAITYMTIPCEFGQFGCRVEVAYRDKEQHEKQCKYRPYICPYIECDHKLAADAVVEHVSTAHREECRRSDGPEITASMILIGLYFGGDGAWSPRLITCFGKTFFDVALTRDRWLHHWVWLLGEEDEAHQYMYEITAFKGNTRYVYGGEVSSLRTSDDDIVSEGQCLSISDAIGRRLRDGDKIRYKLKLTKKSDCSR